MLAKFAILMGLMTTAWADETAINPAILMTDLHSSPRFHMKLLDSQPISETDLSKLLQRTDLDFTPTLVKVGRNKQLVCQLPHVNGTSPETDLEEEAMSEPGAEEERTAITNGLALLSPLRGTCISHTSGWWTFEYCHGKRVRQYHQVGTDETGRSVEVEYVLGNHNANTKIQRLGNQRYLTQKWGQGTICDLTREPRQVEIQYHCDPNGPERVVQVKEFAICQYSMVLHSPRLCADPFFYNTAKSAAYDIGCRQVVADKEYEKVKAAVAAAAAAPKEEEKSKETSTKKKKVPQVTVNLNDPKLVKYTRENKELLKTIMAMAYGDPDIQITFTDQSRKSAKKAAK